MMPSAFWLPLSVCHHLVSVESSPAARHDCLLSILFCFLLTISWGHHSIIALLTPVSDVLTHCSYTFNTLDLGRQHAVLGCKTHK